MTSILVVNLRGTINIPAPIKRTLQQLHLERRFRATVIPDNPVNRGMLQVVKNYAAWHNVESSVLVALLEKRGMISNSIRLDGKTVKDMGFKTMTDMAKSISSGDAVMAKISGLKPSFKLSPPKGGFKRSTRRMYSQGGVLGNNPELFKLVDVMI